MLTLSSRTHFNSLEFSFEKQLIILHLINYLQCFCLDNFRKLYLQQCSRAIFGYPVILMQTVNLQQFVELVSFIMYSHYQFPNADFFSQSQTFIFCLANQFLTRLVKLILKIRAGLLRLQKTNDFMQVMESVRHPVQKKVEGDFLEELVIPKNIGKTQYYI